MSVCLFCFVFCFFASRVRRIYYIWMWLHANWNWENAEIPLIHAIRYVLWLQNVSRHACFIGKKKAMKSVLSTCNWNQGVTPFYWTNKILQIRWPPGWMMSVQFEGIFGIYECIRSPGLTRIVFLMYGMLVMAE